MFGHGTFIYDPREAKSKHGSWKAVATEIAEMGMSHAWLRVHNKNGLWRVSENRQLAEALREEGLRVFGWGWCHGTNVAKDLRNVERSLQEFELDGYVADIEHGVSGASWSVSRIKEFCSGARELLGTKPFLFSTFGFLPYHEPHFIKAADPYVDAFAPQVYWFKFPNQGMLDEPGAVGSYPLNNSASYANLCIDVWKHVVSKPILITGQLYWGESNGWTRQLAEQKLNEFIDGFDRYDDIAGLNWWHFAGNKAMSSKMASAIAAAKFGDRLKAPTSAKVSTIALVSDELHGVAYVRADGLNLRSEPSDEPSTIKLSLPIGQKVEVLEESTSSGWVQVSLEHGDRHYEGVVFDRYLRAPEAVEIEKLLKLTYQEWFRFQRGRGGERTDPFTGYVGDMWGALGISGRDGTSKYAWSAAFISWVLKNSDYTNFKFSALHAKYIHQSIRRKLMSLDGPFWGYRLDEQKPELGDLVCQYRKNVDTNGDSFRVDYDYAEDHDNYFSHCDVVVQVNDRSIRTIGGNTGQGEFGHRGSVSMKTYRTDVDGFLLPENKLFALMKNRLSAS